MKLSRISVALVAVVAMSVGLAGTALAAKPDGLSETALVEKAERGPKANKQRKGKAIQGVVVSTSANAFTLDPRKANDESTDTLTVTTEDAEFRVAGGKKLDGLITKAQDLRAGDRVVVRGQRAEDGTFQAKVVRLTGKTLKKFGGELTAVSSSSITVQKDGDEEDEEEVTRTFALSGTVLLPTGTTLAVGDKVHVVYRKSVDNDTTSTPTAVGVLVKQDKHED